MSGDLTWASEPEDAGIASAGILGFLGRLQRRELVTHSLLIARGSQVAFEGYWKPYDAQTPHRLYSVSKSFASLSVGALIDDGQLGLEDLLIDHFPDKVPADVHPDIAAMRVVDLLTMRTAHGLTSYKQVEDPDWVRTFFTVAPTRTPGMMFAYDTSASVVLAALVERVSGGSLSQYLMERIFARIGFEGSVTGLMSPGGMSAEQRGGRPTWREVDANPRGVTHGGSGLFCLPRDLVRFGQLCLAEGRWGDEQIISSDYVRAATGYQTSTRHTDPAQPDSRCGYGYQFWRTRNNGFAARGMGSQLALCLPEQDLVVVTTGDTQGNSGGDQAILDAVWEELLPAVDGPADAPAAARLGTTARSLALAPVPAGPAARADEFLQADYVLAGGGTFDRLQVRIEADHGELRFGMPGGADRVLPFGIGELVRHELAGYGYETLSSGAWADSDTLQVHSHVTGLYHAQIDFVITMIGDAVTVVMTRAAEAFAEEYEGYLHGRRS